MNTDKRQRTDGRKSRVIHVPLTDTEWLQFRSLAFSRDKTIGDLTSQSVRKSYKLAAGQ